MTAATQTLALRKPASLLRKALWLDVVASGGMAVLLLLLAPTLTPLLGLDAALLRGVGASFAPFVAFVAWTGSRHPISHVAAGWVVGLNVLWVVGCLAIALFGWLQPTMLGTAFIVAQALFVGVMAELQLIGLKRDRA